MKFWQRCLILGFCCFLMGILYYHTLLGSSFRNDDLHKYRRAIEERLGASSISRMLHGFSLYLDPQICAMDPGRPNAGPHPHSNISTLDVYQDAHFNILDDGMYELPTPPPEYPSVNASGLEPLTVIIMPHSHVDPGWHETTKEYYRDKIKDIFANMVNKLTKHPDLTFVWAETIYFAMWWNELEDTVKDLVRRLICRGQLEIALGGWVMPDEASTHYVSVIDQLVEGHQWLWENLQVKPQNSWSIDPFGHSGTMPYLWKQAGMDNMVVQRVHQAVKASLMSQKSLEFYWQQYWDEKGANNILCHVMPYMLYSIKFSCGPNPFICLLFDFRHISGEMSESRAQPITESNVEKFSEYLNKQFRQKSYFYKFNTILVPTGDDFRFDKEIEWDQQYDNFNTLMKYMKKRKDWNIKVKWGTLKDYFQLTRQEQLEKTYAGKATSFPVLSGDFFPYSDRHNEYWTGYYTTRPFDKRFQREVQSMIQAADTAVTMIYALYKRWGREVQEKFFHLASLMRSAHTAQGQFLHHDAITGTSRKFVVKDFELQLLTAFSHSQSVMQMALQALMTQGKRETPHVFYPDVVRKAYNKPATKVKLTVDENGVKLFVYNPLPQYRQQPVHVMVNTDRLYIKDYYREVVPCQINPVWEEQVVGVKSGEFEVVFVAELPPFAVMSYIIYKQNLTSKTTAYPARISVFNSKVCIMPSKVPIIPPDTLFTQNQPQGGRLEHIVIENDKLLLRVNAQTGNLMDAQDKVTGNKTVLDMDFQMYRAKRSGAYLFHPWSGQEPLSSNIPLIHVVDGPLMVQLTVEYKPYVSQTYTLYKHPALLASAVHIRTRFNIQTCQEREMVLRVKTDLKFGARKPEFFADQNGMQFIRRVTNDNLGVEANYYPMTSGAWLDDGERRVSLLSAQPHGVASLKGGWMEVMLDRNLLYDDGRGLSEGVQDLKPTVAEFVLLVETRPASNVRQESSYQTSAHQAFPSLLSLSLADRLQHPVQTFYSLVNSDIFASFQPSETALPCEYALLSLRSLSTGNLIYNGTSLILHRRAYDCGFVVSDLQCSTGGDGNTAMTFESLFKGFGLGVQTVRETSLTHLHHKRLLVTTEKLDLQPMEIASFHIMF